MMEDYKINVIEEEEVTNGTGTEQRKILEKEANNDAMMEDNKSKNIKDKGIKPAGLHTRGIPNG
jgi:hypothetical protein